MKREDLLELITINPPTTAKVHTAESVSAETAAEDPTFCMDYAADASGMVGVCNRRAGHDGWHIAAGSTGIAAVWGPS